MFGHTRGFRGWPIQWNRAKCCGADPSCHGNEIWAMRGDPLAYRLVVLFVCLLIHLSAQRVVVDFREIFRSGRPRNREQVIRFRERSVSVSVLFPRFQEFVFTFFNIVKVLCV